MEETSDGAMKTDVFLEGQMETIQTFIQTLTKILQNLKYLTLFLLTIGT